ncbi:protein kinase [Candidatus Uabimicrobium sp. HlEnr_7]|uniref:protein kinase domain-containing protein n=1 Tax=Candidatus Uabimicrobium helgolandensis TaxID=3095367 RepID=UPI0035571231
MSIDEWLIQQVVSCNLISSEQLQDVQKIKDETNSSYEQILINSGFMLAQQLQQMKSQYDVHMENTANEQALKQTMVSNVPVQSKYRTIRKLGEGNFGEVFLIYDNYWKRNLALKVLKSNLNDEVSIKRFQREARSIAKLHYPGVVKVYDMGEQNGKYYYTMDYIEGQSLDEYLKQEGRLSSKRAARIIRDIAKVVEHAHDRDVIHRDIKPENVMIGKDGKTYVTDFGLAKGLYNDSKISQNGNILGTPSYMSPEQAQGKKNQIDKRSDIYGIGATLYELMTGRVPFAGKNTPVVLYNIVHKYPRSPRSIHGSIPENIERICLKCLEKDKNKRYESIKLFLEDIDKFLEAKTLRISKSVTSPKKMNYNILATVCGVIIALIFALTYSDTRTSSKRTHHSSVDQKKVPQKTLQQVMWEDYRRAKSNPAFQAVVLKTIQQRFPEDLLKTQMLLKKTKLSKFVREKLVDATFFDGYYYGAFHTKMFWTKANMECKSMKGSLVTIENVETQKFMMSYIQHLRQNVCDCWGRCWLGLYRNKDSWQWVTKKPLKYTHWMQGEPNNSNGFEDYVEILGGNVWNDSTDQNPRSFICQWFAIRKK